MRAWVITRGTGLLLVLGLLTLVSLASIAYGSKSIEFATVWDAIWSYDRGLDDHVIVRTLWVPRTEMGLLVGVALGLAGAVMRPGEVQVGIVTAVLGAPFFVALVRRRRLAEL